MKLEEYLSNYVFKHSDSLFKDGITSEEVRKVLAGLDNELHGLSDDVATKIFEDTTFLKSYVDKRRSEGIQSRENKLKGEFDLSRSELQKELEQLKSSNTTLKANMPLSADPAELRKQALDEVDLTKREILNMKADNIELKNQNAERIAREEQHLAELNRKELESVARKRLGDRKLPSFVIDNIGSYLGSDEETTIGKIDAINSQWDDFRKDMVTASIETTTPAGTGEEQVEYNFNKPLEGQNWMNK